MTAPNLNSMSNILGECEKMRSMLVTVKKVAASPSANVLILGESGTGKELIAHAIHEYGPCADQPFVEINCSALPETLIETELFGYEPGAFTDAKRTKKGLLELADGGTFFMDEIGDLNLRLQVKLVKALEEKVFRRIGGTENIRVSMRILAATNKRLPELVHAGEFREDLFYRLNVVTINAPPLRDRGQDILLLAEHFLDVFCDEHHRKVAGFTSDARDLLLHYPWPGNVRELRNSIERAVLLGSGNRICVEDLELGPGRGVGNSPTQIVDGETLQLELPPNGISLVALEKIAIQAALKRSQGNLSHAARLLKISRETLRYRVKKHQLV